MNTATASARGSPPLVFYHPASCADAAGSSLHQRGGTPHPEFGPLNPVTSGLPRSFPGTSPRRSGGRDRAVGKVQRILAELRAEDGLQRVPVQGQK